MIKRLINYFCGRDERQIFEFFDGQRSRSIDPIGVHIDLELHPEFNWDDASLIEAGDPQATQNAAQAVCDVFGVRKWDPDTETGLTIAELLALLDQFLLYCETVKKNTSAGLTSPAPTD